MVGSSVLEILKLNVQKSNGRATNLSSIAHTRGLVCCIQRRETTSQALSPSLTSTPQRLTSLPANFESFSAARSRSKELHCLSRVTITRIEMQRCRLKWLAD